MNKKTLYIAIDESTVPNYLEKYCETLDCRNINFLCSFLGDALIDRLTDEEGVPYFILISSPADLITDFEEVNKNHLMRL